MLSWIIRFISLCFVLDRLGGVLEGCSSTPSTPPGYGPVNAAKDLLLFQMILTIWGIISVVGVFEKHVLAILKAKQGLFRATIIIDFNVEASREPHSLQSMISQMFSLLSLASLSPIQLVFTMKVALYTGIEFIYHNTYRVLRAMKAFEEEEAQIMKDVPGWTPGDSVYHTKKWLPPHPALLKDLDK